MDKLKTVRIIIGFLVSIPVIISVRTITFLNRCLQEYYGWMIDLNGWSKKWKKN